MGLKLREIYLLKEAGLLLAGRKRGFPQLH
jgi:hypothetical protein